MKQIILALICAVITSTVFCQTGAVGIGTSSPATYSWLHVKTGGSGNFENITIESPSSSVGFGIIYQNPAMAWYLGPNGGNYPDGRFKLFSNTGALSGMLWMPDGRVGIGNYAGLGNAPGANFEVKGSLKNSINTYTDFPQGSVAAVNYFTGPAAIRGEYRATGNNDGSGIVGIATQPSDNYGVGVTGTGKWCGILGVGQSGGTSGIASYANGASYAIYANGIFYLNGNFTGVGTNTYASDRKLKRNIETVDGALDIINHIKPSLYEFRVGEFGSMKLPEGKHYGLIAQDLQQVLPELVTEQKYIPLDKQEKGFSYLGVNYNELIPILVKGMQEQQQTIEQLKARITELEKHAR